MPTYQTRNPRAVHSPLRSMPMIRSIESVFGPSPRVRAEAELRIAKAALDAELVVYAREHKALGDANHRPMTTRRYWQAQAMRALNGRRRYIRQAPRRLVAAQTAVENLTPADDYATPWLAQQAAEAAAQAAAAANNAPAATAI